MDPKLESNCNSNSSTDENEGILDTYRRKYFNSDSANGESAAPHLQSYAMPSLLNSPSHNDNNMVPNSTSTVEIEEVTNDDLQAMKNMIGDIKKDPSLLYRLSSLFYVFEEEILL